MWQWFEAAWGVFVSPPAYIFSVQFEQRAVVFLGFGQQARRYCILYWCAYKVVTVQLRKTEITFKDSKVLC